MRYHDYPVRYALFPIKDFKVAKIGKEYLATICYIVTKAYLLKEEKYYTTEDKSKTIYTLLFPYLILPKRNDSIENSHLIKEMEYLMNVQEVFNTYEEAADCRNKLNTFYHPSDVERNMSLEYEIAKLTKQMRSKKMDSKVKTIGTIK